MSAHVPATFGPWRVLQRLGGGGMGTVYRAVHASSGKVAALKTVDRVDGRRLAGLRREIHVLSRLEHPGVAHLLDQGLAAGVPWYAMELVDGTPLGEIGARPLPVTTAWLETGVEGAEWPEDPEGVPGRGRLDPEELRRILGLVRKVCDVLAYIHGEGLVHRDLKPQNILVRADGTPVLVDFGNATWFGTPLGGDPLEVGDAVGTYHYMAPEQIRGEVVDARADLYALGCLLYVLLTGRPPHLDVHAVRRGQEPARASHFVAGLPSGLDDLLARLLRSEPAARLGYATDVAAALEALGSGPGFGEPGPSTRPYLYRARLVGRRGASERLRAIVDASPGGPGEIALLAGESGVGKTRLASEIGGYARRRGHLVITGQCLPPRDAGRSETAPLEPLRGLLQHVADRCRERGPDEAKRLLGPRVAVLVPYEVALSDLFGSEPWNPEELPAESARVRLWTALSETLAILAAVQPVLLILDDLQWADELTLGLLVHLARTRPAGVLVVGTFREEEAHPSLDEVIAVSATISLGRLEPEAVGAMAAEMLAVDRPPAAFTRFLARESEGNPFFVVEYLRAAVGERLLSRDPAGTWRFPTGAADASAFEGLGLPRTLHALVARRLDAAGPRARHALDVACVLGREVDADLLATVAGLDGDGFLDATARLMDLGILEDAGESRTRFTHDKVREVAYERIPGPHRAALHRAAAEALEELPEGRREDHARRLGVHWERAGIAHRARHWYRVGAEQAIRQWAMGEAEHLYRAYLSLVDAPSEESVQTRVAFARKVLKARGASAEMVQQLEEALDQARRLDDRDLQARVLRGLAAACVDMGDLDRARDLAEEARVLARQGGDAEEAFAAEEVIAQVLIEQGESEAAFDLLQRARAFHVGRDDRLGETRVLVQMGGAHRRFGRLSDALAPYEEALTVFQGLDQRSEEATCLGLLAATYQEIGDQQAAGELYERALALHREIGDRFGEGRTLANYANVWMSRGDLARAVAMNQEGLEHLRAIGDRRMQAVALTNMGEALRMMGRMEEAEPALRRAVELCRAAGARLIEGAALRRLAGVVHGGGRVEEGLALAEQALALLREVGFALFEGDTLVFIATLRQAQLRFDDARQCLEQALQLGLEVGSSHLQTEASLFLARLLRQTSADPSAADPWIARAEEAARQTGNDLLVADCLVERGHLALARRTSAREVLAVLHAMDIQPDSYTAEAVARLEHAEAGGRDGATLVRGEHPEDLEEWVRRWRAGGQAASSGPVPP